MLLSKLYLAVSIACFCLTLGMASQQVYATDYIVPDGNGGYYIVHQNDNPSPTYYSSSYSVGVDNSIAVCHKQNVGSCNAKCTNGLNTCERGPQPGDNPEWCTGC